MINLLAGSLLSLCLLSPAQSVDCAGGIGVSVPTPVVSSPVVIQLPVPLPLPSFAPLPAVVPPPVQPPIVLPPAPLPAAPPIYPVPATAPDPAPADAQSVPVVVVPDLPAEAAPAAPVIVEQPKPEPPPAYDALGVLDGTGPGVPVLPALEPTAAPKDAPYDLGSLGADIGKAALEFPDFAVVLLVLVGLGIILITERLDESPDLPELIDDHPDSYDPW